MTEPTASEHLAGAGDLDLLSGWLAQTAEIERVGARFTALAEAAPAGVIVLTRDRTVFANGRVSLLLGRSPEALATTALGHLFPDVAVRGVVRSALSRAWSGEPSDLGMLSIARPDGSRRAVSVAIRPLPREMEPTLLIVLGDGAAPPAADAGGQHQDDAVRMFGLYLATLANDLRAPLTAYLAHLNELTARGDLPAELRDAFQLYHQVTSDTLDRVTRAMEWGRRTPLRERVDLSDVISTTLAGLEPDTLLNRAIRLELDLPPVPPVVGIATQLRLALEHVVRNACEALAGRGGTIRVALGESRSGGAEMPARVTITVSDDGPGIPDSLLPHVFQPFSSTKSIATGLGLGLAIVKDIVNRHRGEVGIETGTAGTTVTLAFETAPVPAAATTGRKQVLIVDDNAEIRESFGLLLSRAGYDMITAGDTNEALEIVATQPVHALIVDVQLTGRDGLALVEALALWYPHLLPRVALQTGFAYEARVRAMAERYGVALLAKPCPTRLLLDTVRDLVDRSALHEQS